MTTQSLAQLRKCVYPHPVYVAEFEDGTVGRMSFWQPLGKPWNFEHGRSLCEIVWRMPVVTGYVEQNFSGAIDESRPWHRVRDPMTRNVPAKPKRTSVAEVRAALRNVLRWIDGEVHDGSVALETARKLAA